MKQFTFIVDNKDVVNNLQRLSIEIESRQSLIAFMIQNNMSNFNQYEEEYKHFFAEYNQAKTAFQNTYVNPRLIEQNIDLTKAFWSLDFDSQLVTVTIYE